MAKTTKLPVKEMTDRLRQSASYRVAYKDLDFLNSAGARSVRLQLELLKTETSMQEHDIHSTIVVFGGARIVERDVAVRKVRELERHVRRWPNNAALKCRLEIARSIEAKAGYYDEAREFARLVSSEFQSRNGREFVIMTGGGPGIMEAANRGAYEVGAKTIGLNITLPMEQQPNPYITPDLCFQFHYFAIRKMHFLLRARAMVAFPGGFGTLDEVFEALTLVQTGKTPPLPIVLFGEKFWKRVIDFDYLVAQGTIHEDDLKLFVFADRASDAWNYIKYFWEATAAD
jgi:uncharacterized protein (TIGR00730 family)